MLAAEGQTTRTVIYNCHLPQASFFLTFTYKLTLAVGPRKMSTRRRLWSKEEDEILLREAKPYLDADKKPKFTAIAESGVLPGR